MTGLESVTGPKQAFKARLHFLLGGHVPLQCPDEGVISQAAPDPMLEIAAPFLRVTRALCCAERHLEIMKQKNRLYQVSPGKLESLRESTSANPKHLR